MQELFDFGLIVLERKCNRRHVRRGAMTTSRDAKECLNKSGKNGAPEEIRTPDPQIRSLVLYPAELRARKRPENR